MKLVTLLEDTALAPEFRAARGLSLYVETPRHTILFDAGPGEEFAANAAALGVDLGAVDTAVLSHGHSDHGDGLAAFFAANAHAPVYVRPSAFGGYYARTPEGLSYVGLSPALEAYRARFVPAEGLYAIDEELTLFDAPAGCPAFDAGERLREVLPDGSDRPDGFGHEQHLLITAEGRAVVLAGCGHRGLPAVHRRATELLGREPEVIVGGFHLFQLVPGTAEAEALLRATGDALAAGKTVYYTGHCTGDWAFGQLRQRLGEGRLQRIRSGSVLAL